MSSKWPDAISADRLNALSGGIQMKRILFNLLVVCAALFTIQGHAQITTGTVSGTVADISGAVLPGASVVLLHEETGITRTLTADGAGRYSAPSLAVGSYRVTAGMDGFQSEARTGIVLTIGREAVVNFSLPVGAVSQTVEVTGEAPLVQTTESTVSYLIQDQTIRDLPLNGRDLTELILLNPGVSAPTYAGTDNAFGGFGKKISVSGFRGQDNAYLLDGAYINDFSRHVPAGPSGALLGAETVQEFQMLTTSLNAQYGRVLGGVFNGVSKSGTNTFHGTFYEFLRNNALDARNFFDEGIPPFRRNQFGVTGGGPAKRDKTFFFAAYEGMREVLTTTKRTIVPDAAARTGSLPNPPRQVTVSAKIRPFLDRIPLPSANGRTINDGTAEYVFPGKEPTTENFGQGRVDHQFSESDAFFARFTASDSNINQVLALPEFGVYRAVNARLLTISETHTFSPRLLSTARFHFNRVFPMADGIYPDVPANLTSVPGEKTASVGFGWVGHPQPFERWVTNRFSVQDDVNFSTGSHTIQFGAMFERMRFNMSNPNRTFGDWAFASVETFLQATPRQYRGTPNQFGNPDRHWRQNFTSFFVQDDWKFSENLTLNLGVRWEPHSVPNEIDDKIVNLRNFSDLDTTVGGPYWKNKSWATIGPRVGFAWSPFADDHTAVRGGFGMFFVPADQLYYFFPTTRTYPLYTEFQITNPSPALFPDALATIAASNTARGSITTIPYENFKNSSALQYNLNVQRQFGAATVLTLGYVGNRGVNLVTYSDLNVPIATYNTTSNSLETPATATRLNRNFTNINVLGASGNSWYNAFTLSFERRITGGLRTQFSYAYSKALSEGDGYASVDRTGSGPGPMRYGHDRRVDKSLSGYDVGSKLSMNYTYQIPSGGGWSGLMKHLFSGWQLTGIVTLQDGQPFTVNNAAAATPATMTSNGLVRNPGVVADFDSEKIVRGGPVNYFDGTAFYLPAGDCLGGRNCELGNVGRNTILGPGLAKWDSSLTKMTSLTERWKLQFRAEFFNTTNRVNFGKPNASVFTLAGGAPLRLDSAGRISTTVTDARQIQFGLKLTF